MLEKATIAALAERFHHSTEYLTNLGLVDTPKGVEIQYGSGARSRLRTALSGEQRFRWSLGEEPIVPYGVGLNGLVPTPGAGVELFVVEGESDCWALWSADYPAIGIPGSTSTGVLEAEHVLGATRVLVVREPDEAGAQFVERIAERLVRVLGEVAPELRVVTMHEGTKDPAELLVECGGDRFRFATLLSERIAASEPVALPEPERPPTLTVRPLTYWVACPPPPLDPLVTGLIMPRDKVVVGGARGQAKSWLAMGIALQLARGEGLVLGHFPVAHPSRVLFCHGELMDDASTWERWLKLAADGEIPAALLQTFDRWRVRPVKRRESTTWTEEGETYSGSEEWFEGKIDKRLVAAVEEHQPDVVVLDPWRVFNAGDENSNDAADAVLTKLDELTDKYGVTWVLTHHFSQARQGEPEDWWRGATRLGDWASVRVTLVPAYSASQAKGQGMSRVQARQYATASLLLRRLPTPDEFGVRFDPQSGWWVSWTSPEAFGRERSKQLGPAETVALIKKAGGRVSSTNEFASLAGVAHATAKKMLEVAEKAGVIRRVRGARGATAWRLAGDLRKGRDLRLVTEEDESE